MGLGSNNFFGSLSPVDLLSKACIDLQSFIKEMNVSSVYKTAAMYVTSQADFYNMVVSGFFEGSARDLLFKIHEVENKFGRNRLREIRFGPRTLDIDIELFGNQKIVETDLVVPHERMIDRAFVLAPYVEILEENADSNKDELTFYKKRLSFLRDQRIEVCMTKADFKKLSGSL